MMQIPFPYEDIVPLEECTAIVKKNLEEIKRPSFRAIASRYCFHLIGVIAQFDHLKAAGISSEEIAILQRDLGKIETKLTFRMVRSTLLSRVLCSSDDFSADWGKYATAHNAIMAQYKARYDYGQGQENSKAAIADSVSWLPTTIRNRYASFWAKRIHRHGRSI